jgi:toxin ParE1/3/4
MRLFFDEDALDDLHGIFSWIAKDNPRAARRLIERIFRKLELLLTPGFARMGRIGREPGTHELIERPYIIVYEVREQRQEIIVLAVFHGARRSSGASPPREA